MELGKLKELLGVPGEDTAGDASLQFILDDVQETILNYCNIDALPAGLVNTGYRMAIDLFRFESPGQGEASLRITSVSEGDTSTSFANASEALSGGVLKNYQEQLNRYRRIGW